jgi:hypothetical protein
MATILSWARLGPPVAVWYGVLGAFGAVAGGLGGGPGTVIERRGRGPGGRRLVAASLCGALVPLAGLLVVKPLVSLAGVLRVGPEGGFDGLDRLLEGLLREPGTAIAFVGGGFVGLAQPVSQVVGMRLAGWRAGSQVFVGVAVLAVVAVGLGLVAVLGVVVAGVGGPAAPRIADLVTAHPLVGGGLLGAIVAAMTLVLAGLPLALLLPPALALADRAGRRPVGGADPAAGPEGGVEGDGETH